MIMPKYCTPLTRFSVVGFEGSERGTQWFLDFLQVLDYDDECQAPG